MNFIIANWQNLLVILVVLVVIFMLLRLGCRKQVDKILLYLVTKAEAQFGGGTGELKFASVVTWLYDRLPTLARWILTKKTNRRYD